MIATYIQELLAANNRVIVPNYGAFLVRATSKSKDATSLKEKLKDVYFSPFLKFNDELLEKYIIKKETVTKEQAAQKITQFIDDIKKDLDQEKPYVVEGFGQFVADKHGKVQFNTIAAESATEEKAPVKKAPATKKAAAAKKEKPKAAETKTEEKPKAAEIKKAVPVAGKEEPEKTTKLEEFKAEKKEAAPAVKEPDAKPATEPAKPIYSYKKTKKPINKGLVWSIAIGVPVAAVFVWALLNFNTVKNVFIKEKAKTEKVAQKKKATTTNKDAVKPKTEETATQETATKTKKTEVKKPVTPVKKYYIIAGSFKNEKYANSFLNKLKTEGYNAEKLAKRNGMHAVSYNSFTDKRKAIAEYKFLAQEKGLQAWILYY